MAAAKERTGDRGMLGRLLWAGVGFGLVMTGFALMLSVFLAFIGLPLFVVGLALVQSQERGAT